MVDFKQKNRKLVSSLQVCIDILVTPIITRLHSNPSAIALAAAFVILAAYFGSALLLYARHVVLAVSFPFALHYGEGLILDQILRLASGEAIYRSTIAAPPYTITNSPPLFFLLQVPLAGVFGPAFWYGRVISVISLVLAAIFLGLTVYQLTGDKPAAAISGLLLFSLPNLGYWSVLSQVDTLALALSWAGLFAIVRWPDKPLGLILSTILFTAAIYTQKTYVLVAPVTALVWLLQSRRIRQAVILLAGVAGTSLVIFLGINRITQGGFFFNLVTVNANIWNLQQVAGQVINFSFHTPVLGLIVLTFLIVERTYHPTRSWPFVLSYYIAANLVTLLVGKAGPNEGYLFEMSAALCLAAGAAIAWATNHWVRVAFLILIAVQVGSFLNWNNDQFQPKFDEKIANQAEIAQLAEMVRQTDGPLLIDEYNGLLPLAGKRIYYEPFEFKQLLQAGLWDPTPLMSDISQQKFPTLYIYFPRDLYIFKSNWAEYLYSHIVDYYDHTGYLADALIFHPKK